MKPLTSKQYSILQAIYDTRGYPPTYTELAGRFGMTSKGIYDHVSAIEKKGFLEVDRNQARGLRLTESGLSILGKKPWPSKRVRKIKHEKYMKVDELKMKLNVKQRKRIK